MDGTIVISVVENGYSDEVVFSFGLETGAPLYEVQHGCTLRVWVFLGAPSISRANLERIMTYHGGPELRELRT